MKILCEPTGNFSLTDVYQGAYITPQRPAVVTMTEFINQRTMLGQLRKVGDLPDNATDAEFGKYWEESAGDKDLAVASYMASFDGSEKEEEKEDEQTVEAPVLNTGEKPGGRSSNRRGA